MLRAFLVFALVCTCTITAQADTKVYTHTVRQIFGGAQSPDDARIAAMTRAKREVLEKAGTYLESMTVVQDYRVSKDEVLALAAGVLRAEIVSEKKFVAGEAFGIEVTARVEVDPGVLKDRVAKLLNDREAWRRIQKLEAREKELLGKMTRLENENEKLKQTTKGSPPEMENLKAEFNETSDGLKAVEFELMAEALWDGKKFTDPGKVIELLNKAINIDPGYFGDYCNRGIAHADLGQYDRAIQDYDQAIRLDPNHGISYGNRGSTYTDLGQYDRAIQDFDQAIRLDPNHSIAYCNRGATYAKLGQYDRAIQDYDQAIRLDPNDADAYYNRGVAYAHLDQHDRAIQDYDQAIRLDPDHAISHCNRGSIYFDLGQYDRAIQDFDQAIRLDPNDAIAYYNRGETYARLGQYDRAIQDYDQVIRLAPDNADAYEGRGLVRILSGYDDAMGCRDLRTACQMGACQGYEIARQEGLCP